MSTYPTVPFNIELLVVSSADTKGLNEIKTLSIFDNTSKNFHPEGLFSTSIFGKVGSEYRTRVFGYIDLKAPVLHPLVFDAITASKAFYGDIMAGKSYAKWSAATSSLEESNAVEGKTGMAFFLENLSKIKFERNESITRDFNLDLIFKALKEDRAELEYLLVLPAGLRDYIIDQAGKPTEDDVNKLYRKILMQASLIDRLTYKMNPASADHVNYTIQKLVCKIYEYFQDMLEGKNKLILGKLVSRKTFNSTRNVFSSNIEQTVHADDPTRLGFNETAVGLFQFLRSIVPMSLYHMKNNYLVNVFPSTESVAYLTNVKTLKKEQVFIKEVQKDFDNWVGMEGLLGVINKFGNNVIRHEFVTLDHGHYYMGLIYNDGECFKFLQDIDEVPEGRDKAHVKPITLAELLYISVYKLNKKLPGYVTRYPISGFGSIYPSLVHMRTTIPSVKLYELDNEWNKTEDLAICFPITDAPFFDTQAPHHSHLTRLGADFDGDMGSLQVVLSDEAIEEVNSYLKKASYYVDDQKQFSFSIKTDTLETVLGYLTTP